MNKHVIKAPFFEVGPKIYLYGQKALELALRAEELSEKYDIDIIFSAQYTDIAPIAAKTHRLHVFAQHMDPVYPGRGVGAVLPEAVADAGAEGVLLNHAERPLSLSELHQCLIRCWELGLTSLVAAGCAEESAAAACLKPDIVLAESPRLIGTGTRSAEAWKEIRRINAAIHKIDPDILILHGAGIKDDGDVYEVIRQGADATGSTSGILRADKPYEMMEKMVSALKRAWDERKRMGE